MATTAGSTHPKRLYRLDFSARHNMATGMLNTALTALSAAVVARLIAVIGVASPTQTVVALGGMSAIGVNLTLLWGAFSRRPSLTSTIIIRIVCWIGAGLWAATFTVAEWNFRTLVIYGMALAVGTAIVGFLGWMCTPTVHPDQKEQATEQAEKERQQLIRDDLAAEWRDRIARMTRLDFESIDIPGIQDYPHKTDDGRRVGYTLEVHLPKGGYSWQTILQAKAKLENDLDLPPGCDINVRMGKTRRVALVDVTTVNILDEEQLYPTDYSPLSIYDRLPMMVDRRGAVCGPRLREENLGIFGEGGSGKSNTGQVIAAGIARMVDTHLCDIDTTGARLSMPLIHAYLQGRVKHPAVWWVASDVPEARLMLRAFDRAAVARNNGYHELKLAHGDDKMPISPDFPQFVVRCDEIKHTASISGDPVCREYLRRITDDQRDAGIRAVMLGLRGTNDIIIQGIQVQLQNLGVLRAQAKSEYVSVFSGQATGLEPTDAPYPGCIQMRLGSAGRVQPYHVWRLVGKQIDDIAVAVSDYQPGCDALTWNALNGRDANGKPFTDLLPGELDCCATRWDRLRAKLGYTDGSTGSTQVNAPKTVDEAQQDLKDAVQRAEEAVAKRQEQTRADEEHRANLEEQLRGSQDKLDHELRRIFGHDVGTTDDPMDGYKIDSTTQPPADPETTTQLPGDPTQPSAPVVDTYAVTAAIISAAGPNGIEMSAIHAKLAERGIVVDRATVHKWLKSMTLPGGAYQGRIEWRPDRPEGRNGRWYAITSTTEED